MTKKHKTRQRSDQGEVAEKFNFLISLLKRSGRFKLLKQGIPAREAVNDAIRKAYKKVYGYSKKAPHTSPAPVYLRKLDSLFFKVKSNPKPKLKKVATTGAIVINAVEDLLAHNQNGSLQSSHDAVGKGIEGLLKEIGDYQAFVLYHRLDASFSKFQVANTAPGGVVIPQDGAGER